MKENLAQAQDLYGIICTWTHSLGVFLLCLFPFFTLVIKSIWFLCAELCVDSHIFNDYVAHVKKNESKIGNIQILLHQRRIIIFIFRKKNINFWWMMSMPLLALFSLLFLMWNLCPNHVTHSIDSWSIILSIDWLFEVLWSLFFPMCRSITVVGMFVCVALIQPQRENMTCDSNFYHPIARRQELCT